MSVPPARGLRLVLATRNAHKVEELRALLETTLADLDIGLVGLEHFPGAPEVVEHEVSFAGNALLKANAIARHTGLPALADDSGLCVDVLGGAPGIFSARWSGGRGDVANYELLLAQLGDVPDEHRGAHFACAAALALPDGRTAVEHGRFHGTVAREPRGTNGFGYDPIFVPAGGPRHLAEYADEEKNVISHRALAFRALEPALHALVPAMRSTDVRE